MSSGEPEPWLRRRDWAAGHVNPRARPELYLFGFGSTMGTLVFTRAALSAPPGSKLLINWLFAVCFAFFAFVLLRALIRHWQSRGFRLELESLPARTGETFAARLQIPKAMSGRKLNCILSCRRSLSQQRQEVCFGAETVLQSSHRGTTAIEFPIPAELPVSRDPTEFKDWEWVLEIVPADGHWEGRKIFLLPIFGPAADQPGRPDHPITELASGAALTAEETSSLTGTEFVERDDGFSVACDYAGSKAGPFLGYLTLVMTLIICFLIFLNAPWKILLPLAAIALMWLVIYVGMRLRMDKLVVKDGRLLRSYCVFGRTLTWEYPLAAVQRLSVVTTGQFMMRNFFGIRIELEREQRLCIGVNCYSWALTARLAARIQTLIDRLKAD